MKRQLMALLLATTVLYPLPALAQGNAAQTQQDRQDPEGPQGDSGTAQQTPGGQQQPGTSRPSAQDTPEPTVTISVAQLDERDVTNESGNIFGEIEQVVRDEHGSIAVIFPHGGYLGIGEKEILVPVDWLSVRENKVIVRLSNEQIAQMQPWTGDPQYVQLPRDSNLTIARGRE